MTSVFSTTSNGGSETLSFRSSAGGGGGLHGNLARFEGVFVNPFDRIRRSVLHRSDPRAVNEELDGRQRRAGHLMI